MRSHFTSDNSFLSFTNLTEIFAAIATILTISIIGILDDLVRIRQSVKATLPLFASLPLVAVAAGHPYITLPLLGQLYLPIIYPIILIPLAVAVVSNLTNMLAGFNGLESGMGLVACLSLGTIAFSRGGFDAAVLLLSMSGALFAFMLFNKYPARVLPGDVGTLSIGACIASAVIIGNFETAGVVVMIPYLADFVIKVKNGFPKEIEVTELKGGKLTASKVVGLPSLIMRLTNGISETRLVMLLVAVQTLFGLMAVLIW
jgi:UDP-N-acetylglucosamine--dolichyl-phosphate N-acetylglucosaminephosphotransferase